MQTSSARLLCFAKCIFAVLLALGSLLLWLNQKSAASPQAAAPLVVFALDGSCSMLASSGDGTRLSQAQKLVRHLAESCPDAELALISFGGDAMVDFPPSLDREGFLDALEAIEPTLSFSPGSDPGSALRLAQALARERAAVVVLVTDGELQVADESALAIWPERSLPLVWGIVGSGPALPIPLGGSWLRDPDTGEIALSQADDSALKQLAGLSEAFAWQISPTAADRDIAAVLNPLLARRRQDAAGEKSPLPSWALALAVLAAVCIVALLVFQTRVTAACALLVLCAGIRAGEPDRLSPSFQLSNRAADLYDTAAKADEPQAATDAIARGMQFCIEALRINPANHAARINLQLLLKLQKSLRQPAKDEPVPQNGQGQDGENTEDTPQNEKGAPAKNSDMDDALGMAGEAGPAKTVPDDIQKQQRTDATAAVKRRPAVGTWRGIVVRERPLKGRTPGIKPW